MQTLTTEQANALYTKGLAFVEGVWHLTTRHALYEWDVNAQRYEATSTGLRVTHSLGAHWNGHRFVPCACEHCKRYPAQAAEVDIAGYPVEEA